MDRSHDMRPCSHIIPYFFYCARCFGWLCFKKVGRKKEMWYTFFHEEYIARI